MLSGLTIGDVALLAALMLGLDWVLGGAWRRYAARPIMALAAWLERLLNRRTHRGAEVAYTSYWRGVYAWILAVLPLVMIAILLVRIDGLDLFIQGALLFACLGVRRRRAGVEDAIRDGSGGQLNQPANQPASPEAAEEAAQPAAATDQDASLLGSRDRIILSTLFWFIVAGAPAALLYRLALALAAIWDARGRRFRYFGSWAARARYALDWPAARLIAWSCALLRLVPAERWQAWQVHAARFGRRDAAAAVDAAGAPDGRAQVNRNAGNAADSAAAVVRRGWSPIVSISLFWIAGLMLASALSWAFGKAGLV